MIPNTENGSKILLFVLKIASLAWRLCTLLESTVDPRIINISRLDGPNNCLDIELIM